MKTIERDLVAEQTKVRPDYVSPEVRIMNEQEILSAFQITAAGSVSWWVM